MKKLLECDIHATCHTLQGNLNIYLAVIFVQTIYLCQKKLLALEILNFRNSEVKNIRASYIVVHVTKIIFYKDDHMYMQCINIV